MDMAVGARMRWVGAAVLLCSLGACTEDGEPNTRPMPTSSQGSTTRGEDSDLTQFQEGAASAADQIASGDGLRVENKTGGPIALTFPDGDTAWVAAGEFVVVWRPCRDRLPLRAESETGELIAERDGPCRQRDTWTLE